MKLTIALMIIAVTAQLNAQSLCPMATETLFEVVKFTSRNSADSRITKGTCQVKTIAYGWYDLLNDKSGYVVTVDAGECDEKSFEYHDYKPFIKGNLSYTYEVGRCGSKLGCHYECTPDVSIWPF